MKEIYDKEGRYIGYEIDRDKEFEDTLKRIDKLQESSKGGGASWRSFAEAPISHIFGWLWWIACIIALVVVIFRTKADKDALGLIFFFPLTIVIEILLGCTIYPWIRAQIEEAEYNKRHGYEVKSAVGLLDAVVWSIIPGIIVSAYVTMYIVMVMYPNIYEAMMDKVLGYEILFWAMFIGIALGSVALIAFIICNLFRKR